VLVILMGPAGAGKSTVGQALAAALGWLFIDADDLHTVRNIEKIREGTALTDRDREPWLARIHETLARTADEGYDAVIACSALRQRYRDRIAEGLPDVRWVYLAADARLLAARLAQRTGHFAGPAILSSQLAALQPPTDALVVPADQPVGQAVATIRAAIGR
jgi:gluconokinase